MYLYTVFIIIGDRNLYNFGGFSYDISYTSKITQCAEIASGIVSLHKLLKSQKLTDANN